MYNICVIARLWVLIMNHRFTTHHGQESSRLSRTQSILAPKQYTPNFVSRAMSHLTLGISDVYTRKLDEVFVDDLVYTEQWHQLMQSNTKDWKASLQIVRFVRFLHKVSSSDNASLVHSIIIRAHHPLYHTRCPLARLALRYRSLHECIISVSPPHPTQASARHDRNSRSGSPLGYSITEIRLQNCWDAISAPCRPQYLRRCLIPRTRTGTRCPPPPPRRSRCHHHLHRHFCLVCLPNARPQAVLRYHREVRSVTKYLLYSVHNGS